MSYFSQDDFAQLLSGELGALRQDAGLQRIHRRLADLHSQLYPRLKQADLKLYPNIEVPGGVSLKSASLPNLAQTMTLSYMRSPSDAEVVEGIMGRDALSNVKGVEAHRHPVIELRLTPEHFVVELIVGPDAWYDQQNLIGKLSVSQNRTKFYQILSRMKADYMMGFWLGIHLDDTHLNTGQLPPPSILFEYLDTFADRRDWLRVGRWYDPDDPVLHDELIVDEVFERIRELHRLYGFIAWSHKNNFHSLYEKTLKRSKR